MAIVRIAHVITRLILGGAQENTLLTCEALLREHGDEVLLVTGPPLGPEGSLVERARAGGVPLEIVPTLRRAVHPWRDWQALRAVGRVLRDFQPDVVHTHSAKAGILGRLTAHRLGVPAIVHTVHGPPVNMGQGAVGKWLAARAERYAARRCHGLITVADAMTEQVVEAGIAPREKCTRIYSGMEVEPLLAAAEHREQMRAELGYGDDHVVVGKIARLFPLKGHRFVLAAARQVVSEHPHVRFLFVGDGVLRDSLEQQADAAGLADHVRFAGLVPPDDIPAYLSAMDMLVHASLREGLPRSVTQALLTGRPAVCFNLDGAPEVVLPEVTGLLVPPEDEAALAAAIGRFAADPQMRIRLGAEGQRRWSKIFDHRRMTAEIRALYERILSRRPAA